MEKICGWIGTFTCPYETTLCNNPMIKHNKYLYEIISDKDVIYDYAMANDYFSKYKPQTWWCSSFVKWNVYARNLDWTYDNSIQFVIRSERNSTRLASVAVVDSDSHVTADNIQLCGSWEAYDILIFKATDWINENWVYCNINVVPWNEPWWITTSWTNPSWENMCMLMICRWILDNALSATWAVEKLKEFNIFAPSVPWLEYEYHFMIWDSEDVYIVDFEWNEMKVTHVWDEWELPAIMTNFRNYNTQLDEKWHIDYTTVSPYGSWLERYDLIADNIESINSVNKALDFMSNELKYTNTYTWDWITEFVWDWLTVSNAYENPEMFNSIREKAKYMYEHRSRNKASKNYWTWQTTHTSVYDIVDKTLNIKNQEWDNTYVFTIPITTGNKFTP